MSVPLAQADLDRFLAPLPQTARGIVLTVRSVVLNAVPDAQEELDGAATTLGFTFIPGTYKGLFAAIIPHKAHVNLMFAKGVELLPVDRGSLLEGTGKVARHIAFTEAHQAARAEVRDLVLAAAERTTRPSGQALCGPRRVTSS